MLIYPTVEVMFSHLLAALKAFQIYTEPIKLSRYMQHHLLIDHDYADESKPQREKQVHIRTKVMCF